MTKLDTESEQTRAEVNEQSATEHTQCPECGGRVTTDDEHAEKVCSQCGLVVEEDEIDRGPEWRAFDASERDEKARVGAPTTNLMHDKGLSSQIGWQNSDASGNSLSARQRKRVQRMRTWDERFRTRNHQERNLKQALAEIERMGSALGLPKDVRETASVIYRRALDEELLPGRSIEGVATAAIYAAARQMNAPRSLDEVAAVSRVDAVEFKRTYRYVVRELGLAVEPANPQEYVGRLASDLDVSNDLERTARDILETAEGTGAFNGKSPVGLAAAALYAAGRVTDERLTQEAVSEAADVSTVTIRNRYQELLAVYTDDEESASDRTAETADENEATSQAAAA